MDQLIWVLIIGAVAGWLAGQVMKGRGFGVLGNIVVGIVGSMLGHFAFGLIGIEASNLLGRLLVSLAGAILLIVIVRAIKK